MKDDDKVSVPLRGLVVFNELEVCARNDYPMFPSPYGD